MKIKLIAPHEQDEENISSAETFKIQRVSLPLLAALTPEKHTVKWWTKPLPPTMRVKMWTSSGLP